jgi:hypothetical protein
MGALRLAKFSIKPTLKYPIVGLILNLANLKAPIVGNRINAKEVKIEGFLMEELQEN